MDGAAVALLLLILGIAGVLTYIILDYNTYKTDTSTRFAGAKAADDANKHSISTESTTRLSNVKYVVDQVNSVNDQIYTKTQNDVAAVTATTDKLGKTSDDTTMVLSMMLTGMDNFLKFGETPSSSTNQGLYMGYTMDPTVHNADLRLMQHTTAIGGLSVPDLTADSSKSNMKVRFCGAPAGLGASPACIELPNAEGDTYFTSLVPGKKIVMGAPVDFKSDIALSSGKVNIGGSVALGGGSVPTSWTPTAALEVYPKSGMDALSAGSLTVDADDKIVIKSGSSTAVLSLENGALVITPPSGGLRIDGDVNVSGSLNSASGGEGSQGSGTLYYSIGASTAGQDGEAKQPFTGQDGEAKKPFTAE
jgi:hypothetical protein